MDLETLNKANGLQRKIKGIEEVMNKYYRYGARVFAISYRSDNMSSRDSYQDLPDDLVLPHLFMLSLQKRVEELKAEFDELMPPAPASTPESTVEGSYPKDN